jgi:hypothetical protein
VLHIAETRSKMSTEKCLDEQHGMMILTVAVKAGWGQMLDDNELKNRRETFG